MTGEIISLTVAVMWTITSLVSEIGSKRLGVHIMNTWRLALALLCTGGTLCLLSGSFLPLYADTETWLWMGLSGFIGFFLGDYCLFKSYIHIGACYGQLFMTLAPAVTAVAAWVILGQELSLQALLAMVVTILGIVISILGKSEQTGHLALRFPWRGMLFGIGAGMGQGLGLVLSKIGMDCYTARIPACEQGYATVAMPFAANFMRCAAGFACIALLILLSGGTRRFFRSARDGRGMAAMAVAVLFGPFLGVAGSLMAVQYTAAGIASTLMAMTPILVLWPAHWLFRTPITLRNVVGAVISCVGVALFFC